MFFKVRKKVYELEKRLEILEMQHNSTSKAGEKTVENPKKEEVTTQQILDEWINGAKGGSE